MAIKHGLSSSFKGSLVDWFNLAKAVHEENDPHEVCKLLVEHNLDPNDKKIRESLKTFYDVGWSNRPSQ